MAEDITVREAAEIVVETEVAALEATKDALDALDITLGEVFDTLDLPLGFQSDAKRIVGMVRGNIAFIRSQEIPNLLARYSDTPIEPGPLNPQG